MAADDNRERRNAPRLNFDIDGVIKFSQRHAPLACVVRDISETGARLQVESGNHIPDAFQLHLEHEGFSVECIVVWRSDTGVGVTFEAAPEL